MSSAMSRSTCGWFASTASLLPRGPSALGTVVGAHAESDDAEEPEHDGEHRPVPKRPSSQRPNSANTAASPTSSTASARAPLESLPRRLLLAEFHQRTFPHQTPLGPHETARTLLPDALVNLFAIYCECSERVQTEVSARPASARAASSSLTARRIQVDARRSPVVSRASGCGGPFELLPGDPYARGGTRRTARGPAPASGEGHERVALLGVGRHQGGAREQRGPRPQDHDRAALARGRGA